MSLHSIELFAGAGGLALGVALAGFKTRAVVEWDQWACDTIRENQRRGHPLVAGWPVIQGDVRDWVRDTGTDALSPDLDLIAGGPPCQPFSMGGKHKAHQDSRDMFPVTVQAIRRLRPRAFIIENVKGLTRSAFHDYYQYILLQLQFPEIALKPDESWSDHNRRLQRHHTAKGSRANELRYRVTATLVNAANLGVPQRRERVFIVGFRHDVDANWCFPRQTHSLDSLLHDQWVTGHYWDRHEVARQHRPAPPQSLAATLNRLRGLGLGPMHAPWQTVRDALRGLPEPTTSGCHILNHRLQVGARSYPGHTGSPLDLPAKTLKAGDHGVPGGENMLLRPDGSVRYFTVRESARLQTFPDGYELHGSWSEAMRQLGNAVPMLLGRAVAASVAEHLLLSSTQGMSKYSVAASLA